MPTLEISADDLVTLKASAPLIEPNLDQIVVKFYDQMKIHPDMNPAFMANRREREAELRQFLGSLLPALDNVSQFFARFAELGVIHRNRLRATERLMQDSGTMIVTSMAESAAPEWPVAYTEAWQRFMDGMTHYMLEAANAARR